MHCISLSVGAFQVAAAVMHASAARTDAPSVLCEIVSENISNKEHFVFFIQIIHVSVLGTHYVHKTVTPSYNYKPSKTTVNGEVKRRKLSSMIDNSNLFLKSQNCTSATLLCV